MTVPKKKINQIEMAQLVYCLLVSMLQFMYSKNERASRRDNAAMKQA